MSKMRIYHGLERVLNNNKSRIAALTLSVIMLSSFEACTSIKKNSNATNSVSNDSQTKISNEVGNQLMKGKIF